MTQRIDYQKQAPELFNKLAALNMAINKSSIEETINHLVEIRASQMNGCTFCLDMHIKQATIGGERPLRIHHLAAWRESTLFSPRERAALARTEALTRLPPLGVSDEVYEQVRNEFSEKEITDLSYAVMAINAWNRINIAFRATPGTADKAYGLDKAGLA
jgi:AhpD family alkylhydroperoxidase